MTDKQRLIYDLSLQCAAAQYTQYTKDGKTTQAAMLAAWFSQGRDSGQVAVDYTQVRNVRKPNGARPGMVIYDPYQTAYVTPDEAVVKSLAGK